MKLTVYADVLLTVNFFINYILLKLAAFIGGIPYKTKNLIFSARVGALFSLCLFTDFSPLVSFFVKSISVLLCTGVAFGFYSLKHYLKSFFYLITVTFIFAGVISLFADSRFVYVNNSFYYININPVLIVLCISVVYAALSVSGVFFSALNRKKARLCEITFSNFNVVANAFFDSGFSVKDILRHRSVMLCSIPQVKEQLDNEFVLDIEQFFYGRIERPKNVVHIFYSDISGEGILPAVKADKITISGKELKNTVIAFTDKKFSGDTGIIFGKDIQDMLGD